MNWAIIIIETAPLVLIFTAAIMIPLIKNPVWWIHDYPKDIQERYFETHGRIPIRFFLDWVLVKKGFAVILSSILLALLIWPTGADSGTLYPSVAMRRSLSARMTGIFVFWWASIAPGPEMAGRRLLSPP